jgi:hypothetical protein
MSNRFCYCLGVVLTFIGGMNNFIFLNISQTFVIVFAYDIKETVFREYTMTFLFVNN